MPYNLLAQSSFTWRGSPHELRLYELDYPGQVQGVKIPASSLNYERATPGADVLKPHLPSQFGFDLIDEGAVITSRIVGKQESDFRLEIDRGATPLLVGRMVINLPEEALFWTNPTLRLMAYDGATSLSSLTFLDAGHYSFVDIPRFLLAKLGFGLDLEMIYNWRAVGQRADLSASLGQRLRIEDILSSSADRTCYDVLLHFLEATNAQLWQEGGVWRIAQRSARGGLSERVVVDSAGTVLTSDTIDRSAAIADSDATLETTKPRRRATSRFVSRRPYDQQEQGLGNPRFTQPVDSEGPWEITGGGPIEQVQSALYGRRGAKIEPGDHIRQEHPQTFRAGDRITATFKAEAILDAAAGLNTIHSPEIIRVRAHEVVSDDSVPQNKYLTAAGDWVFLSDPESYIRLPMGVGGAIEPRALEAFVKSRGLPFDARVWFQMEGPAGNPVDYIICVEASVGGVPSEQATALRAVLDLSQPGGGAYKSEMTIGDATPDAPERGAIEYQDDLGAWHKTRDWATAQGNQSFQQLRVADRAGQESALLEGLALHLPARVATGFEDAIVYNAKRYIPLYEKEAGENARKLICFPHDNLANAIPNEYLELAYGLGFDLPAPPRVRVETDQIDGLYNRFGVLRLYPNYPFLVSVVRFKSKSGGNLSGDLIYTEDAEQVNADGEIFYERKVELHPTSTSQIQAQVRWQPPFGTEEIVPVTFDFDIDPEIKDAFISVDAIGRAVLFVTADEDTHVIKYAANKGPYPASADDPNADVSGSFNGQVLQNQLLIDLGPGQVASCLVQAATADGYRESAEKRVQAAFQPIVNMNIYFWDETNIDITFKYDIEAQPASLALKFYVEDSGTIIVDKNFTGSTQGTFTIAKFATTFNSIHAGVHAQQDFQIVYARFNRYVPSQP